MLRSPQAQLSDLQRPARSDRAAVSLSFCRCRDLNCRNNRVRSRPVARARLQVDALKWASAKLLPKVYGDRGDRQDQDDKPKAIAVTWAATEAARANIRTVYLQARGKHP
jgi:hypothetical protein